MTLSAAERRKLERKALRKAARRGEYGMLRPSDTERYVRRYVSRQERKLERQA